MSMRQLKNNITLLQVIRKYFKMLFEFSFYYYFNRFYYNSYATVSEKN